MLGFKLIHVSKRGARATTIFFQEETILDKTMPWKHKHIGAHKLVPNHTTTQYVHIPWNISRMYFVYKWSAIYRQWINLLSIYRGCDRHKAGVLNRLSRYSWKHGLRVHIPRRQQAIFNYTLILWLSVITVQWQLKIKTKKPIKQTNKNSCNVVVDRKKYSILIF